MRPVRGVHFARREAATPLGVRKSAFAFRPRLLCLLGICFRVRRTGNGQNGEGRRGVRGSDPQVELVNADPLHNKEATVRVILEKGGDYLVGTKENTARRLDGARRALKGSPFLT